MAGIGSGSVRTKLVASFPPAHRNSWYVKRSLIGGEVPDSFHATFRTCPPASVAPAEGVVNSTSANAWGATAARRTKSRISILKVSVGRAYCDLEEARDLVGGPRENMTSREDRCRL